MLAIGTDKIKMALLAPTWLPFPYVPRAAAVDLVRLGSS